MVVNTRNINNSKNIGDILGKINDKEHHKEHIKNRREDKTHTEIENILETVTTKIDHLKDEYAADKFKVLLPKLDKVVYEYPRTTTSKTKTTVTEDLDFIGTAQIEALLNDIKARAIQMVAEQNPSVTDIITNTVTETTFEADPILTHIEMTSPGYALTTFVCLNNIDNIDKRTANNSNYVVVSGEDNKHSITVRSVKESAYTIAHSVEDALQKEFKSIYKMVKEKVSKDFQKEVKQAKSTLKTQTCKAADKVTKASQSNSLHLTTQKGTTKSRQNRGNKKTKTTSKKEDTTVASTIDDFAMLTLYEQILAKTHEDNVMKMLATNKKRKIAQTIRLSKRNPETLTDLNLKKDIKRIFDDGETIPDIDYSNDMMLPQPTNDYPSNTMPARKMNIESSTESTPEDTSYEGLSDKLAYKDYVNGFKNYLQFQRDEAKENFSALVRYQAHKHHNVDDIGKFILNKIPQIPKRKRRHFFEEMDVDDQDVSTKSDDSWFKKHFYMFIDNGPPKKYHTSERVEFKDVTEASRVDYQDVVDKPESQDDRPKSSSSKEAPESFAGKINLDELTRFLEDRKKITSISPYMDDENSVSTPETKMNNIEEGGIGFRVYAPNIISKFFKKRQKGPDIDIKNTQEDNHKDHTLKYEDEGLDDDDNFLFNVDLTRFQRSAEKEKSVEESKETHTTVLNKQSTKTDKAKSDAKVGCVSIVTQPTAVVNLHKSNAKLGKVQRLLNRLHFRSMKNHKKKKEKRHCTRVQRFNPFQKLKDMFASKPDAKNPAMHEESDYDMVKAHIDTFKPVKYNKIPSLDELKHQVPNITSDLGIQDDVKDEGEWVTTTKMTKAATEATINFANDYTLNDLNLQQQTYSSEPEYASKYKDILKINDNHLPTDNIMNVNIKPLVKKNDIFTVTPVTIEDIRRELDKLQQSSPTVKPKSFRISTKVISKTEPRREVNSKDDKEIDDDITIKAKLTRVAQYPIVKNNSTNIKVERDSSKLYEFADSESYLSVHEFPFAVTEKISTAFDLYNLLKKYDEAVRANIETTTKLNEEVKFEDVSSNYKTYPDYFHDLVRWNNDILNYDKISSPTWQDILKNIKGAEEYTTPSVQWISKELSDMTDHLRGLNIDWMDGKDMKIEKKDPSLSKNVASASNSMKPKYVAKADGIKVHVGNNNKQTLGDFDEDSYITQDDAKVYAKHKSQDIINVLNNLYTKRNYYADRKEKIMNAKNNEGALHINSTAIQQFTRPHEDEIFFNANTNDLIPKKLSKNSLVSAVSPLPKQKQTGPIPHSNKMPKQFYNTPLPMKNEKFEQFLKENALDVKSLTSPITNMPVVTEKWYSKMNSLTKIMNANLTDPSVAKEKNKATESFQATAKSKDDINNIVYKLYPETQIEYLNDLEQDLIDDNAGNARLKRYNVHDYDSYTDSGLIGTEKMRDFKNKFSSFFDKKPEAKKSILDSVTDHNDDLEITIINLDDVDNRNIQNKMKDEEKTNISEVTNPNSQVLAKMNSTTKNLPTIEAVSTTKAKNSKKEKNNENLQENSHILIKDEEKTNISEVTEKQSENQQTRTLKTDEKDASYDFNEKEDKLQESQFNSTDDKDIINTILSKKPDVKEPPSIDLSGVPNEFKHDKNGNPKRVRITSHSYRYDVVYQMPSKPGREDMNEVHNEIDITPFQSTTKSKNSENGVTDPKPRAARSVKTTSKRRTFSQTIHFTTKKKNERNKRLFKLIPILKEKLMNFARMKSSTAPMKSKTTNTRAKTILNFNATELRTSTAKSTVTKRKERNSGLSYNFDDMFNYKVFTVDGRNAMKNYVLTTSRTNRNIDEGVKAHKNKSTDYVEGRSDYDIVYYETEMQAPANITSNVTESGKEANTDNKLKRDVDSGVRKAKDVAALELVVDLMRSPQVCAERTPDKIISDRLMAMRRQISKNDASTTSQTNRFTQNIFAVTKTKKPADYIEGHSNYDVIYYEQQTIKPPENLTSTQKQPVGNGDKIKKTDYKLKRDVANGVYTAKDVAALEVIIDLMKNPLGYADKPLSTPNNLWEGKCSTLKPEHTTNSIQVHIAVPYDISNKKRCSDHVKVRKVFTAKLATPVDIVYQIHSVEDNMETTTTNAAHYGLTPGMYLIVDDKNKTYAFKSIELPSLLMKEGIDVVDETADETKSNKMKINKEFVAAVNKYLIQLYDNITNNNQNKIYRKVRDTRWDKIKKNFGHDRVCSCKCKANKPMCSTCAACDPVIKELIFEFDNLAKYMSDHCTEIQTYFWTNPTGGRALRDTIHKIDKSLNDYLKRVKGKCSGRKCNTFSTYMDKRAAQNKNVNKNYIGEPLLNDLKSLTDIFDLTAKFIPYDETLKDKGDELVNIVSNCLSKSIVKRTNCIEKKSYDKSVYTVDNISVNIICSTDTPGNSKTSPVTNGDLLAQMTTVSENLALNDLNKRNCKKCKAKLGKKTMLQKLFKHNKDREVDVFKREVTSNQIESPLIADTGGSFWHEYLNKGNAEQKNEVKTSDVEVSVVQTNSAKTPTVSTKLTFKDKLKNIRRSKMKANTTKADVANVTKDSVTNASTYSPTVASTDSLATEASTESFSYNINDFFNIFNTINEVTAKYTFTDATILTRRNHTRTKKIKTKKHKKIHTTSRNKMYNKHKMKTAKMHDNTNATSTHTTTKSDEIKTSAPTTVNIYKPYNIQETVHYTDTNSLPKEDALKSTTKMNLFDKIKQATLGFLSNIGNKNSAHDNFENDVKRINTNKIDDKKVKKDLNVISTPTTQVNPTILIISDNVRDVKEVSKYKSILLSLLNYESSKLDKEREKLRDEIEEDITNGKAVEISHGNDEEGMGLEEPMKTSDLDYDMYSIQDMKPEPSTPSGPQEKPGLLERVAYKFGVKANDKVAATSAQHLRPKQYHHHHSKRRTSKILTEEAEPTKSMKLHLNSPNLFGPKEPQTGSDYHIDPSKDIGDKRTMRKSKNNRKSSFDSYIREDHGIYRLRKKRHKNMNYGSEFRIAQNLKYDRYIQRKKHKRSNAEIKNSQRLSVWLQHSAGFFVATITSFYIVLATFAAVVNWVFGR